MKLRLQTAAGALALAMCAGAGVSCIGISAASANGVGNSSGSGEYQHNTGGVGVNIGTTDPTMQPLLIPGLTLREEPVEHQPTANEPTIQFGMQPDPHNPSPILPSVNLDPQDVTHNPSPVVPGILYDPQAVTHSPSPVVPGVNYDPIGVVHNPSPVLPAINYSPRSVTHSPSPVIPGIQLGQTDVTHRPNVPNHNINLSRHTNAINIPINLPNLNIDVAGMVATINPPRGGCRRRCNGGETNVNVEVNITRTENRETLHYRGGNTYVYVEDRTPTYTEFSFEETTLAHEGLVPLRVACLDTSGGVHPASQVFPDEYVSETYVGEIYRCVIGTSMQVTMGEMEEGAKNFQDGWAMTCNAGEALIYGEGELTCAPQIERRPCNERSLLRRHGPGEKIVRLNGMSMTSESGRSTLAMDGGVGAYRRY